MRTGSAELPPGPRTPSGLQMAIWWRQGQWLLRQSAARFGDTFTLRIAQENTWVVTSDPAIVKEVFTGDNTLLHAGEANRILLPVLGPHSVLLLDEAEHLRQRKLLLPPFHGERMLSYGELMTGIASREIERWPLDLPYKLRPRMQALTLEIILRAVFGVAEGPRTDEMRRELRRLIDMTTSPLTNVLMGILGPMRLSQSGTFRRALERADRPIYEEIASRRQEEGLEARADIMSMLLQAKDEHGAPMSDEEIRDELVTLLVAGHETTANALAWAVERLCRHPEKLRRLTQEVHSGETAYLDAVVQETLRLRPVISIVIRRLTAPMTIGGLDLPAGVCIAPCIYLMHRRPEIYPEPEEFRPERFLEEPPGTYTWIPFGGGIRRCLGAAFAQFEMKVVLRELLLRRTVTPVRHASERIARRAITETPAKDANVFVGRLATGAKQSEGEASPRAAQAAVR